MHTLLLSFLLLTSPATDDTPKLTIDIKNIEVLEGNVRIGIFNASEKFLKQGLTFKNYLVAANDTVVSIVIDDLPKGEYAFMLYHDKNSDGKMNQNFLGIPKEPFGFSNNVKPKFAKPTFEECKFSLTKNRIVKVRLGYFK